MSRIGRLVALIGVLTAPSITLAQITDFAISDGSVNFSLTGLTLNRTNTNGGLGDLRTATGAVEHLFQNWFWYRAGADTREYALSNQVVGSAFGNRARLVYQEPSNDGATANALRVEIEYTVSDLTSVGRPDTAEVVVAFKVQNLTANTLVVQFFNYNDLDLGATATGDSATAGGALNHIQMITDSATTTSTSAVYKASSTNLGAFQIGAFASIRTNLADTDLDNLSSSGSPFVGDYTGAFQWGVSLAAAGSAQDSLVGSFTVEVRTTQPGDLTGDGCVDLSDLALLLANFGANCP